MMRVSFPTISRWETDEDHPRGQSLVALADALDLSPTWFTDDQETDVRGAERLPATIPVFGYGSAGEGIEVDDHGYPVGHGDFEILRSLGNTDPHSYATRVKGRSMYPYLMDGDIVEVVTNVEVKSGHDAVVIHEDGRKWIKRVKLLPRKHVVVCEPLNPDEDAFELPADKVTLHRIIGLRRKSML